ncbi:MAG TPA: hypothetical protein VMW46_10820, partial [Candidatus Desulfaltia sp.]|nr:hypothetical protein [Candidatus Desulfaltia sp.]
IDAAHHVPEALTHQRPSGLVDFVLPDVRGDGQIACLGKLGRKALVDIRPVVDDIARASMAVNKFRDSISISEFPDKATTINWENDKLSPILRSWENQPATRFR